jgi:uncharacterized protein (TIGR01777 family)
MRAGARSGGTHFTHRSEMPVSRETLAAWHFRAGALERLVPGWSGVRVLRSLESMVEGVEAELSVPLAAGIRSRWRAVHREIVPGRQFVDEALSGPFPAWRHVHRFLDAPAGGADRSVLEDDIHFRLPFGPLGALGKRFVLRDFNTVFAWRHTRTRNDLRRHGEWPRGRGSSALTVAITGASGLVGRALTAFLTTGGHRVLRIGRRAERSDDIRWDVRSGTIDAERLEGCDAIVHLAGESIAGRWTDAKRTAILESRVAGTDLIARTVAGLKRPPRVLVSASAIGIYGNQPSGEIDESSAPLGAGNAAGFLAEVCRAWERAADPARAAGVRVVHPRIGMVLASEGGALAKLVTPFSLGAGGPVGGGEQGMSWIALDDLLGVLLAAICDERLVGAVNAVAPHPVSNRAFGSTLGRVLRRPAIAPLPAPAVRLLFGAMGEELLLAGAFVRSAALASIGFRFDWPDLEGALRFELGRPPFDEPSR